MDSEITEIMPGSSQPLSSEIVEHEISAELGDALDRARQIVADIKDEQSRDVAAKFGAYVATKEKNLKALREQKVTPLRKAYEGIRDLFDNKLRALTSVKTLIAQGISSWDIEQERQRRLEQEARERKAREEREEYERKKRAWEAEQARFKAEQDRIEREKQAALERERQERERKIREEEDARLRHAQEAKDQGNVAKIDRILERTTPIVPAQPPVAAVVPQQPVLPPPPPPPAPAPVQAIVARRPDDATVARDIWQWEGSGLRDLAIAVAEHRAPLEYLTFNGSVIGKDVRKLKDEFRCDGIRTWKERNTTFRASKDE